MCRYLAFSSGLGSGPGLRLNYCQKQGTLTLSDCRFLEGEAVHWSWGTGRERPLVTFVLLEKKVFLFKRNY